MDTTIEPARPEEKPALERLLQLYLHDFSSLAPQESRFGHIGEDGRIADDTLERYWRPGRQAFSIRADGHRAGFALVNDWAPSGGKPDQVLAEFFVARKYRRCGVGRAAAHALFRQLDGTWELAVTTYNAPALLFWRRTLASLQDYAVVESAGDGQRWKGPIFRLTPVR
ncbi:MAG: GNAT family N-acetyltransferase [Reyranellaceae bacterium]